mmetsp:Transcript_50274/g.106839  ORF Transcript_50274/g.106839 Transcript_50274/m.106839 type:complete len:311 (-) Transcript_50274:443-1375(-)
MVALIARWSGRRRTTYWRGPSPASQRSSPGSCPPLRPMRRWLHYQRGPEDCAISSRPCSAGFLFLSGHRSKHSGGPNDLDEETSRRSGTELELAAGEGQIDPWGLRKTLGLALGATPRRARRLQQLRKACLGCGLEVRGPWRYRLPIGSAHHGFRSASQKLPGLCRMLCITVQLLVPLVLQCFHRHGRCLRESWELLRLLPEARRFRSEPPLRACPLGEDAGAHPRLAGSDEATLEFRGDRRQVGARGAGRPGSFALCEGHADSASGGAAMARWFHGTTSACGTLDPNSAEPGSHQGQTHVCDRRENGQA